VLTDETAEYCRKGRNLSRPFIRQNRNKLRGHLSITAIIRVYDSAAMLANPLRDRRLILRPIARRYPHMALSYFYLLANCHPERSLMRHFAPNAVEGPATQLAFANSWAISAWKSSFLARAICGYDLAQIEEPTIDRIVDAGEKRRFLGTKVESKHRDLSGRTHTSDWLRLRQHLHRLRFLSRIVLR